MFPQTELDNYKLQVELLQEKLKRSEERREQMENKFENIMKKKSEHEKISRSRSRAKYQQFLEEQRQRNERNKSLVRMLEEVDQRASLLASRSERLKMLKVQYELYFSRMIQSQCLRSIQPSPGGYPAIPGDRLIQSSVHNPQINEEICQSSNNFVKGTYLPQNWGMIANTLNNPSMGNDFNNIPGFGTYRFPSNTDFLNTMNGPILSHQGTQRQVNLKSTFGDSIASSHGFPNQMEIFADTRNPIDLDHYKIADVNMVMPHGEGDGGGGAGVGGVNADMNTSSTRRVNNPIRSDKHYKNLNESSEEPSQMNSDNKTVFTRPEYNQRQVESERTQYKVSTSDKLQPINQEETPERAVVVEVNDNDKIDKKEDEGEKSQPINTFQQQEKISKKETGNGTFRTPSQTKPLQLNIPSMKSEMSEDMVLKNVNPISFNKPKAPVLWNFNGKIDPNQLPHPLQLGKKEKLSIENIENAIYGERISPTNARKDDIVAQEQVLGIFEPDDLKSKIQSIPELKSEPNNIQYIKDPIQINEKSSPEIKPLLEHIENRPTGSQVGSSDLQNVQPVDAIIQPLPPQQLNPVTEQEQNYNNEAYPDQKPEMENTIQTVNQPAAFENYEYQQPVEYSNAQYAEGEPQQNLYQNQSGENYQQADGTENQNAYQGSESYQYPDQQNYPQNNDYSNAEYQAGDYQQGEYQQQDYQVQPGYEQQSYEDPNNYNYAYDQSYGQDPSYQQGEQQQPTDQYPESYDQQAYSVEGYQQEYANTGYQPNQTIIADGSDPSFNTTEEPQPAALIPALENVNLEPKKNDEENEDDDEDDDESTNKNPMPEEKEETDDEEHVILPLPPVPSVMPPSILSTEKSVDSPNGVKKKKRVNFIDSETEDTSTSAPKAAEVNVAANDESDFDFSTASNSN